MGAPVRYSLVAEEVTAACRQAGRDPAEVRLVAVSKTVGEGAVSAALAQGARDFAENRPDQLVAKATAFPEARWHFIGNIQSRRIRDIVAHAALVHSLHELRHGERIDAVAAQLGKVQDVLVEVNVSGEQSKSGVAPADAAAFVAACAGLPHVRVRGLMTMAPQGNLEAARGCFQGLAQLADEVRRGLPGEQATAFGELSMGMSGDWRQAIAAGATMVRIGRAIFSDTFE